MSPLPLPNITLPVCPNLTLRLALLRAICCLAFVSFINALAMAQYDKFPINLFILLHHIAVPFFPQFNISTGLGDLVITTAEMAGTCAFAGDEHSDKHVATCDHLVIHCRCHCLVDALDICRMFAMLKIINTIAVKGKNLRARLDITDAQWMHRVSKNDFDNSITSICAPEKLTARDILLGRSLWKAKLAGEQKWLILSRGLFAVLFVIILVTFAVVAVILGPVRESTLTPVNIFRVYGRLTGIIILPAVRNVVLARATNKTNEENLAGAVRITNLLDSKNTPCTNHSRSRSFGYNHRAVEDRAHAITFFCGLLPPKETPPGVLVTVNFTELGIQSDTINNVAKNSVQVMYGLVNRTELVVENTLPVTLIPGMNAFAMANIAIRRQFRRSALSTFGLSDSYDTFFISEIGHLIPDPSSSPLITRSPDVATIRIVMQVDPSQWRIIQDFREKSVLRGFSSIGGLWTSLCGIFAVLFGSSILRVMFNVKPFSIFGQMHSIQREEIRDSCLKEYSGILDDLKTSPGDRGIISLLSDHFVDLDFLRPQPTIQSIPDAIPLTSTMPCEDTEGHDTQCSPCEFFSRITMAC